MERINTRIKDEHALELGLTINKSKQYRISREQHQTLQGLREEEKQTEYKQYLEEQGIDESSVSLYWDKSKNYSILIRPSATKDDLTPEYIQEVVSSIDFNTKPISHTKSSNEILRVIITDVHIGMETDKTGYGIFSQVWNEEEAFKRLDIVIEECNRIKRDFKEVHVIDLGDYLDGWNGQTTRGGHNLPQNLSNRKSFDLGVRFKIELYNRLQDLFNCKVVAYNVCNDNHSSDFGFIVNETIRMVITNMNPNIHVNNLQRFMSHYFFGDHCFIMCHGKDEAHMKFGLKPKLDAVIKDRIFQYIKHYDIKSKFITFEKGDSHLQLLDSTSSGEFDYFNYRAFSNASSWVNHNFGKSTSGFTLMTIREDKKSKGIESIEF